MSADQTLAQIAAQCKSMPLPPQTTDEQVFGAPWQAQVFAMTLSLVEGGAFDWEQWAQALSRRIAAAQQAGDSDDGTSYYVRWTEALEDMLDAHGLSTSDELIDLQQQWRAAAARTPHGKPITLEGSP